MEATTISSYVFEMILISAARTIIFDNLKKNRMASFVVPIKPSCLSITMVHVYSIRKDGI